MNGTYDIGLVILSIGVAVIASYVALDLAGRVVASRDSKVALYWFNGGAISMGTGIWSMHFIGMLAFRLPIPMSYDIPVTLLSLLIAMIVSGIALYTVSRDILSLRRLLSAGLYMGIGIAAMHYTGMAAMQMAPPIRYDPLLFVLSVLIAIVTAMAALWIAFQLRSETILSAFWKKAGSALVMGAAISGMHYTGMAAAIFAPNSLCTVDPQEINNVWLAGTIGGFTFMFLITTLLISVFDARLADRSAKLAETLRKANADLVAHGDELARANALMRREALERMRAEQASARLAAIVESSQDAILSRDLDGRLLSWNASAERLFGYTAAEIMGLDFRMVPPERQHEVAEYRALLSQGKSVSNFETVRITKDGRRVDVSLSGSPIRDNGGNIIGRASIYRDITERKQVQQARQKAHDGLELRVTERTAELSRINAELEKFAYVASHDRQEPLRTIINFADLLERRFDDKLDQDGREFLGFIVSNATRMRRLVDDLLELSRTGNVRLAPQPVHCDALLMRVLGNLGQGIAESEAVVTHDPLPTISADPGQIEQLFQNLVGNAIKFHGAEKPAVHVGVRSAGANWVFSVRDNGIGIDPRFSDRIFEMFQRLHSGGKYAGSGVGLAICKKIVERHGGRIWVESREGQGATFFFMLPPMEPGPENAGAVL